MNQGKRWIRNTVFALYGATVLFFGLNRLLAATVHAGAPQWLSSAASLGLAPFARASLEARYLADLGLQDFTRLHVTGKFAVEIIGAPQYHLSFTTADGRTMPLTVRQEGDQLWLSGFTRGDVAATAVLRIETPALSQLDVRMLTGLVLHGLQSGELTVDMNDVPAAQLRENNVTRWILHADTSAEVQVDKATLAAGKLLTSGDLAIRYGE